MKILNAFGQKFSIKGVGARVNVLFNSIELIGSYPNLKSYLKALE
jgi:glutaredoxin-related protein